MDGVDYRAFVYTSPNNNWKYYALVPEPEMMAAANWLTFTLIAAGLLVLVVAVMIMVALGRRMRRRAIWPRCRDCRHHRRNRVSDQYPRAERSRRIRASRRERQGVAVVAAEVRNLAQRSTSAAKEIKTLLEASVGNVLAGAQSGG
jgi:hypothetical protein